MTYRPLPQPYTDVIEYIVCTDVDKDGLARYQWLPPASYKPSGWVKPYADGTPRLREGAVYEVLTRTYNKNWKEVPRYESHRINGPKLYRKRPPKFRR